MINKFFLAGDKFLPEMHLRDSQEKQKWSTKIQRNRKHQIHLSQNELDQDSSMVLADHIQKTKKK